MIFLFPVSEPFCHVQLFFTLGGRSGHLRVHEGCLQGPDSSLCGGSQQDHGQVDICSIFILNLNHFLLFQAKW